MPFPLLLDPNHTARAAFGIDQLTVAQIFSVASAVNYGKALGGIRNFAIRPSDASRTPAVVILDAEQQVVWTHVGKALGDYPTIDQIIAEIPSP